MFKKISLVCALALMLAGVRANASLLLEPYAGYSDGSFSGTPVGTTTANTATIDGFGYGGRIGFMLQHFMILAYEYQGLSNTYRSTPAGSTTSTTYSWTQATQFATVGFQAPMGFRILGSYGFSLHANEACEPASSYTGTAYKLAVGWRLMPDVAVNVEYSIYNMVNLTSGGVTSKISDDYSKFNYSAAMVNISFPFTFFHMSGGGGGGKSR